MSDQTFEPSPSGAANRATVIIKKYANRRLYDTDASAYVTLEDLAQLIRKGDSIQVLDAKTNEDITRSVMTQIIFEQEAKVGEAGLLPLSFLQQLIRLYGDGMAGMVPHYLDLSLNRLVKEQKKLRSYVTEAFGTNPIAANLASHSFDQIEEMTRQNMALFHKALALFNPFLAANTEATDETAMPAPAKSSNKSAKPDDREDTISGNAPGQGAGAPVKAVLTDLQAELVRIQEQVLTLQKRVDDTKTP